MEIVFVVGLCYRDGVEMFWEFFFVVGLCYRKVLEQIWERRKERVRRSFSYGREEKGYVGEIYVCNM